MAAIVGTVLADKITPGDTNTTFPTHVDVYGQGGLMSFSTLVGVTTGTDPNRLPLERQRVGMLLYSEATKAYHALYQLSNNADLRTTPNPLFEIKGIGNEIKLYNTEITALTASSSAKFSGTLEVAGGSITSTQTTFNLLQTSVTTLNIGGAATSMSVGNAGGTVTILGDLAVNGADITTTGTGTATIFNANATTLNIGGAATTVNIGAATGITKVNNQITAVNGLSSGGDINIFYNKKLLLGYSPPFSNDGAEIGMDFSAGFDTGELIISTRDNGFEPIVFRQSKNDGPPSWIFEPLIIGDDHHVGIAAPSGTRSFPADLSVYGTVSASGTISTPGGTSDVWNSGNYGILSTPTNSVVVGGLSAVQFSNPITLNPLRTYELTVFVDLSGASLNANSVLLLSANNNFGGGGRINYFNTADKTLLNSSVYTTNYNILSAVGTSTTAAGAKSFTYDVVITTGSSTTTFIAAVSSTVATNTVRGFSPGSYWKAKALV